METNRNIQPAAATATTTVPGTGNVYVLKLNAKDKSDEENTKQEEKRLTWSEGTYILVYFKYHITLGLDTVNNEKMGKKSSKRCCIYHKSRKL
jgi:hypothetical protein